MLETVCAVIVLLLALYGLSRLLIAACVRLTATKEHGLWLLPLHGERQDVELYLRFAGIVNLCGTKPQICLIDCGLDELSKQTVQQFCERDGRVLLLSVQEAENLLQSSLHSK